MMAADKRKKLESKETSIEDKLPLYIKRDILTFIGKIGIKDFAYSNKKYKDEDGNETYPTFYGNLCVLLSYMDRARLTEKIVNNLIGHVKTEEALVLAHLNPKCLPIPVRAQDRGQWFEATPLQAVYAAGDLNPPRCDLFLMADSKPYKKSDLMHLYLYKNEHEFFYFVGERWLEEKRFTIKKRKIHKSLKGLPFDQPAKDPVKCSNLEVSAIVLDITSDTWPRHTYRCADAKPFGFTERLYQCFQNPANADKQLAEWKKDSQKATEETMAPYVAAIKNTCQKIIECKEISDDVRWEDVLKLPFFLQLDEEFRKALVPDPNHVVRSGFLFSLEIYSHLCNILRANSGVDENNQQDTSYPNLGGWWSHKIDALEAIVRPRLQARSPLCDLGLFKGGVGNVDPKRLDFTNGTPADLAGIGSTHFFGDLFGGKYASSDAHTERWENRGGYKMRCWESCVKQKSAPIEVIQQPSQQSKGCAMK